MQAIAAVTMVLLIPFFPWSFPTQWSFYGLLLLASLFYAANDRLQMTIRRHLHMSVYTLLNRLVFVFLFIYGLQVFNEDFLLSKALGVGLIVGANTVLFFERKNSSFSKYAMRAIIAAFALATAIIIDISVSKAFNLPLYIALTLCIPGLIIMLFERVSIGRLRQEIRHAEIPGYLMAGSMWGASIFFSLRALQVGRVTTVVSFQSFALLVNVALAYFVLKDRQHTFRKVAAACIAGVGMVLLVVN
ncbi:MAG TPA: hypothetical protein VFT16_06015 [Candidatus Saccharimonadales bacterium]|nr:hypothetical protein [Candidatus Saccharimonadales bacterium]